MQRIITANWQYHLLSTICKGHFMVAPNMINGLMMQAKGIVGSSALFADNIQKLEAIDIRAFSAGSDEEVQVDIDTEEKRVIVLPVKGMMLKYGTMCSYGMDEIAHYMKYFAAKDNVAGIVLDIDTGGGACNAVPPLLEAINFVRSQNKPIVSHIDSAYSAGYWTAAATDRIFLNNDITSGTGSIGVMISYLDPVPYYEKEGAIYHEVYADGSEDKNKPFQEFLKGEYDLIRKEMLNPLKDKFHGGVKSGRPNLQADAEGVLTGSTFDAEQSIKLGLADQIGPLSTAIQYVQAQVWAKS
ncbi:S49 family peptidase [Sphingobacterium faecium]